MPNTRISTHSRPVGFTQRLPMSSNASSAVPTTSRPSARPPPLKCGATPRMTMNALAHASTVTMIATSTSGVTPDAGGEAGVRFMVEVTSLTLVRTDDIR